MKDLTLFIIVIIFSCVMGREVQSTVFVSPYVSFFTPPINIALAPGEYHVEPLYTLKKDMSVIVEGRVSGVFTDIIPLICDEENLEKYTRKQPYACWGGKKLYGHFSINEKTYSDTPHYLVFYNPLDLLKPFNTKSVHAQVQIKHTLSQNERLQMEKTFGDLEGGLRSLFEVKEFSIRLESCNMKNAFSDVHDGDIIICSEIIGDAALKGKNGIFSGILMHELGHTLLNLWGLPGWDNERTADEFATVMLIIGGHGNTSMAQEWISFFDPSKRNVINQAQSIAQYGGPHPLDVQRIEAIQRIIDNPLPVVKRWNKILYPRMKTTVLQGMVSSSSEIYGWDAELAKEILAARGD